jgi:hypothetical protein
MLPFLGYYLMRLFSRLCETIFDSLTSGLAALFLNASAFSFFGYYFCQRAHLLIRFSLFSGFKGFLDYLSNISLYTILFTAGYFIIKLAEYLDFRWHYKNKVTLIRSMGQVLIGFSLWRILDGFVDSWPPANGIGLVIFIAWLSLAVANLGNLTAKASSEFLAEFSTWLQAGPLGKFFIGGLAATYFVFIRLAIFSHSQYASLIEWTLICLVSWRIFEGIKATLHKNYVVQLKEANWQKHIQKVDDLTDDDFNKLITLQEDYVEGCSRRNLLAYLQLILINNGYEEDDISRLLRSIIEYSDRRMPWWAFGYLKRRILKTNQTARRKSLDDTINTMDSSLFRPQLKKGE